MAGSWASAATADHAVFLLNRLNADNSDSLNLRPPAIPPMPTEEFLDASA
jgi:hypothetical protein